MPLGDTEVFRSPAFAVGLFDAGVVVCDAPVGAYDAVVSVFLTQQVCDEVTAESVSDVFPGGIHTPGDRVVRHDGCGLSGSSPESESSLDERSEVFLEISARIDGIFPETVMGISSPLFGPASRPVLDHGIDALVSPSVSDFRFAIGGLESVDIGSGQVGCQIGILSEGSGEADPTRFGCQVYLRGKRCGDAQSAVFSRCNTPETFDQFGVERGGESEL